MNPVASDIKKQNKKPTKNKVHHKISSIELILALFMPTKIVNIDCSYNSKRSCQSLTMVEYVCLLE